MNELMQNEMPGKTDIALARCLLDWRDYWEIETELFLNMSAKALLYELSAHLDAQSTLRTMLGSGDFAERAGLTIASWGSYVCERATVPARTELVLLLRRYGADRATVARVEGMAPKWGELTCGPELVKAVVERKERMPSAVSELILGIPQKPENRSVPSLSQLLSENIARLHEIALGQE